MISFSLCSSQSHRDLNLLVWPPCFHCSFNFMHLFMLTWLFSSFFFSLMWPTKNRFSLFQSWFFSWIIEFFGHFYSTCFTFIPSQLFLQCNIFVFADLSTEPHQHFKLNDIIIMVSYVLSSFNLVYLTAVASFSIISPFDLICCLFDLLWKKEMVSKHFL